MLHHCNFVLLFQTQEVNTSFQGLSEILTNSYTIEDEIIEKDWFPSLTNSYKKQIFPPIPLSYVCETMECCSLLRQNRRKRVNVYCIYILIPGRKLDSWMMLHPQLL